MFSININHFLLLSKLSVNNRVSVRKLAYIKRSLYHVSLFEQKMGSDNFILGKTLCANENLVNTFNECYASVNLDTIQLVEKKRKIEIK